MPIVDKSMSFPAWCELQFYELITLNENENLKLERMGHKEKLMVAEGNCTVSFAGTSKIAVKGEQFDIVDPSHTFEITNSGANTLVIRLCGAWGEQLGSSGFFEMRAADLIGNDGDPVTYLRNTDFDSHYHDCDEYYIIYAGNGEVVTELKHYDFKAGDCVVIGKGHHHDIPFIHQPIKGIYFETTLQGLKREGHLWNHTHGPAEPDWNRV